MRIAGAPGGGNLADAWIARKRETTAGKRLVITDQTGRVYRKVKKNGDAGGTNLRYQGLPEVVQKKFGKEVVTCPILQKLRGGRKWESGELNVVSPY